MEPTPDWRLLSRGLEIPTESYSDQPYIVQTADGAWLCCVTTGPGHEGAAGQHVATLRSLDRGRTWSPPVSVEPADSAENSYAVMLKAPSGRVFIFYNHNTDNVREVKRHDGEAAFGRVDSLGHYVFRYSDDGGQSWSARRYDIPLRRFRCDLENVYAGALCFFWNVGRPFAHGGTAYVPLIKVGRMGRGFFAQSEGVLLASPNLLTEADPARVSWTTLPDCDLGLRTPPGGGPIAEEQSYSVLSDGSFYCVYRSIDGHPVEAYSRDGGHSWSTPRYKSYADGRPMKHPRAANFAWKCANGKYLYWFHNHGGRVLREHPACADWAAYEDRNPVWISGGIEQDSPQGRVIVWSEPEILLYDDDPYIRISYPDLVEVDGQYFVTETQKDIARVHPIPTAFLEGIWQALECQVCGGRPAAAAPIPEPLLLQVPAPGDAALPAVVAMPELPAFHRRDHGQLDGRGQDLRAGFALELRLRLESLAPGQVLLDSRTATGQGLCLLTTARQTLELVLNDGRTECRWDCDPVLEAGREHHVVISVDGGPKIVSFIIDGRVCDGGDARDFGWGRFSPHLRHANGAGELRVAPDQPGAVRALRVFGRRLCAFEALGGNV